MARLICLANSWREGGRCVAGIDQRTGQWIRPVPPGGGPIDAARTAIAGRQIAPLDIVEIPVNKPQAPTRYQRENWDILNWNWRLLGRATLADLLPHCSPAAIVLFNNGRAVKPPLLEHLDPSEWCSLELLHVTNAQFEPDPKKLHRWQVHFTRGLLATEYTLPLTDPLATDRLARGECLSPNCLLTASLTVPIEMPQFQMPPLCYKVIAMAIEL